MPTNMTNMTMFKSLKYSCLRICNIDDAKVIVIDRICTCSKLIFQRESNKHRTKTGNKKHRTKTGNQNNVQIRRNHKTNERKQKICEITYSIRIKGKNNSEGWFFGSKLTLNHPSDKKKNGVTARVWEGEKKTHIY
jgi:hypothetical protein